MRFPDGFLWGSSTNAQQFEGGWNEDGKGLSIADVRSQKQADMFQNQESNFNDFKQASDHYHHLEEDIALYGEMGFTIYRFSMQWTRIFPHGDDPHPNEAGLKFYDRMLCELEKYHIQPVCTLYAYDCPQALVDKYGGFLSRECITAYTRYVDVVSSYFKGRIKYYVPFNEQNTMAWIAPYACGVSCQNPEETFRLDHHLNLAWAKATCVIHANDPEAKVGGNLCNTCTYPATCNPADVEKADSNDMTFGYAYGDIFARKMYSPRYKAKYPSVDFETIVTPEDYRTIQAAQPDFLSLTYYMSTLASAEGVGDTIAEYEAGKSLYKTDGMGMEY